MYSDDLCPVVAGVGNQLDSLCAEEGGGGEEQAQLGERRDPVQGASQFTTDRVHAINVFVACSELECMHVWSALLCIRSSSLCSAAEELQSDSFRAGA